MGLPMALKPGKVFVLNADAHIYQAGTSLSKLQITTLLATLASEHYIPSMVIYPGVQPCNQLREDFYNKIHRVFLGIHHLAGWTLSCSLLV